ncbi:hypothetical protein [Ruegeria sp.]|uniref:hypothetical protein n=1 Tax=Ruegeria sp. TaxID=1879320 RepID=UPI003B5B752B
MKLFTRFAAALFALLLLPMAALAQSKADALENDYLDLIFNATAIADLAENDSTSPATNLYLSLHSASPGEAGDQSTNECAYTGYSRRCRSRNGRQGIHLRYSCTLWPGSGPGHTQDRRQTRRFCERRVSRGFGSNHARGQGP